MRFLRKVRSYIREVYPFYYNDLREVFIFLCLLVISSFFFTYLFEPFQINPEEHRLKTYWIHLIHAFIPLPVSMAYFYVLNKRVKRTEEWTIGKEFCHLAALLFITGLLSFLIRDFIYTNPDNWSLRYLFEEIRNTFLIGSLLLMILLPLNLERLLNRHKTLSKTLAPQPKPRAYAESIHIQTEILTEGFELDINTFLYAKVEANYTEFLFEEAGAIKRLVKRIRLGQLEKQVEGFPHLCRVHRSYLVNVDSVRSVSGNAQGYILDLNASVDLRVPVSRSKIAAFNRVYTAKGKE